MRKLSITIPTYNRTTMLYKSYEQVKDMPEVDEIVIVDDHSKPEIFKAMQEHLKYEPKVKLLRGEKNLGVHLNKMRAITHAQNDWCILFDSDNVLTPDYINRLLKLKQWVPDVIYSPSFAMPHFSYKHFEGRTITNKNVAQAATVKFADAMFNTQNCFVNRSEYLRIWQEFPKHLKDKKGINGADSIYFFKFWMQAGNRFYIVPDLHYHHLVHKESFYNSVSKHAEPFCKQILQELKRMK